MKALLRTLYRLQGRIKKMLPRTLFARSLLILVTPIFLVQMITTFIFFDRHWQKMSDRLAISVVNEVMLISTMIETDDTDAGVESVRAEVEKPLEVYIRYFRGELLNHYFNDTNDPFETADREQFIGQTLGAILNSKMTWPFDVIVESKEKWVDVRVQLKGGVASILIPERRLYSSSGYIVLLWMIGSSIVLVIIATLFMRNQIRPIRRLAIAAERFGKGRAVTDFKVEGAREVRQAGSAFLEMKERIQRQIQQRTAMLAGVSHDLRTPLTRMRLQLEMMPQDTAVSDLKNDLADMERMIEAYLQFARGEGGEQAMPTDLNDLVVQAVDKANRDGVKVLFDADPAKDHIVIPLRPVAFARALDNVLGNGLKYGMQVWVSILRVGDMIEICFDDDGPGIPESQYDDVFKPFYRGEQSRNSKTGGVGLGLPIVQDIVHAHGGRVWLDKSPKGGLRVVIDIPA